MSRLARGETVYPRLREIQNRDGFISAAALRALALELNLPLFHLQGLVSFYPTFRTEPSKPCTLRICRDLSCHLAGAGRLLAAAREAASGRGDVEVSAVPCLGRCEQAPALEIGGSIRGAGSEAQVREAIAAGPASPAAESAAPPPESFPQGQAQCDPYPAVNERYGLLRSLLAGGDPLRVLETLHDSGLRGMGGAGFPAALKWRTVREAAGSPKYAICNADESEPGTSKDRVILERWPHLVLEGLLVGMWVTGAEEGWIYLRHEYLEPARALEEELQRLRRDGWLDGRAVPGGSRMEVRIFESPGGYICGEETALLEAMEGKRAEPRNKPPFPASAGLWGRPTLINNVETFAFVPAILRRGAGWFASHGENGARGLKFLALSGHVKRPGVYEVPLGITARRFIDEFGLGAAGGGIKAFAPGGASSGFLPASELDTPLDFKSLAEKGSMLGSGAVVVVAEGIDMADLALNVMRFFRDESCGKCVPCREGTSRAVTLLEGPAAEHLTPLIEDLAQTLSLTSICGLGQVALNPLRSVMKHWPDEWARLGGR